MRAVIQRVKAASCTVDNKVISKIDSGLMILVGITQTDTLKEVEYIAKKIANMRIFDDAKGVMNESIIDKGYRILSISQFTLYGSTKKGNRPSYSKAAPSVQAKELYLELSNILNNQYNIPTFNGAFQEHMEISLINDGPVTLILESK
ncbi:MAG: D-aminoacyl-tRNA deacylase [Candidatus Izemoplasma sp.]